MSNEAKKPGRPAKGYITEGGEMSNEGMTHYYGDDCPGGHFRRLAGELNCGFIVKFEGDPRGHCVRLHYSPREEDYIGIDI